MPGTPVSGTCEVDTFTVTTTTGRTVPTLCGQLAAGQHMFIDAGLTGTDQVTLSFALNVGGTAVAADRTWSIKVNQIPCNMRGQNQAPNGCLQYFTGNSSFIVP